MTPTPPWTVKGVPEEDRERIRRAAERMDLPIGKWIIAASDFAAAHGMTPPPPQGLHSGSPQEAPEDAPARVGPLESLERLVGVMERLQGVKRAGAVEALGRQVLKQWMATALSDAHTLAPKGLIGHVTPPSGDDSMT